MASWNLEENGDPGYLIFNDSVIQESVGSPRFSTIRLGAEDDEVRMKFRSKPRWRVDLSGLLLTEAQYEDLLSFQWNVEGMLNPFLVRNNRNYLFENSKGQPSLLGMTDDGRTEFQLRKPRHIQGRTDKWEDIYFPNWNYPDLLDMNNQPWLVLPELEIYVGGLGDGITKGEKIEVPDLEVDRNTGLITIPEFADGLRVDAYGGFFTLMVCNEDEIPVKRKGGMFQVDKGVSFEEPSGDA